MYCTRPATHSPSVYRIVSTAPKRNAHFFPGFPSTALSAPLFGRAASQDPFRALDRMLEDFTSPSFPFAPQQLLRQPSIPTFQPRFDVREAENGYELRGEIPGVESKDLEVEFTDPQTLVVRGRTERESSSGTPPQAVQSEKGKERITNEDTTTNALATEAADTTAEKAADNSDAASTYSSGSYQKPSVEDADAETTTTEAKDTPVTTPGEPATEQQQQQQVATQAQPEAEQPKQQSHYWISERSTGSFQRVFKFPTRVDQAAVTASLKNGILNIVVPRAAKPEPRRIRVE